MAVGTSNGVIQMFEWDWFGDCKDRIKRHGFPIECLVKYDENTLIAGCEDGWVRIYGLSPVRFRVFEIHADDIEKTMSIDDLAISRCRRILASVSDDCCVRFYDISNVQEFLAEDKTDGEKALEENVGQQFVSDKKRDAKTKNIGFFGEI